MLKYFAVALVVLSLALVALSAADEQKPSDEEKLTGRSAIEILNKAEEGKEPSLSAECKECVRVIQQFNVLHPHLPSPPFCESFPALPLPHAPSFLARFLFKYR